MNILTFAQICGGFLIIVNKFFYYFITLSISLSYKAKINLAVLFRYKNSENASLPTTRTANSTLGIKRPILLPRYTIYYYIFPIKNPAHNVWKKNHRVKFNKTLGKDRS